jgi:hypothetical protein
MRQLKSYVFHSGVKRSGEQPDYNEATDPQQHISRYKRAVARLFQGWLQF